MNMMRKIQAMIMVMGLLATAQVFAEKPPFVVLEVMASKVRVAQDGTGIVQDVSCTGCESSLLKITPASKATASGVEVSILEVRNLRDKVVMVSFSPDTQEVQYIRW